MVDVFGQEWDSVMNGIEVKTDCETGGESVCQSVLHKELANLCTELKQIVHLVGSFLWKFVVISLFLNGITVSCWGCNPVQGCSEGKSVHRRAGL